MKKAKWTAYRLKKALDATLNQAIRERLYELSKVHWDNFVMLDIRVQNHDQKQTYRIWASNDGGILDSLKAFVATYGGNLQSSENGHTVTLEVPS